jgi:PAS domain S-box-containing protein
MSSRDADSSRERELNSQIQYRLIERIAETGDQYRELIEGLREIVFCSDAGGQIQFLNRAWTQALGYDVDFSIGRNSAEFVVPQHRSRFLSLVAALHYGENLQYGEVFEFMASNGERRLLSIVGRGQRNGQAAGLLRDITDDEHARVRLDAARDALKKIEQQLEYQRRHTSMILEGVADGVLLVDSDQRTYYANSAARSMLGLQSSSAPDIDFPLRSILERGGLGRALLGGEELKGGDFVLEGDESVVVHLSISPTLDEQGAVSGQMIVFRDVTKEREIERMKSDFVASCSHELRTPLTSILGFARRMSENRDLSDAKREQCVEIILAQSGRLQALITGLLDLSRIDSGEFGITPTNVDLPLLLSRCVDEARGNADEVGVRLCLKMDLEGDGVIIDEEMTGIAIRNLLSNAVKFSASGQTVSLNAVRRKGLLRISVQDDGLGIPADRLTQIFERFYRVPRPGLEIAGTGFGLTIVREIAERQSGAVHVTSRLGEGSTFTLQLPV